jgi:hypothetical protein
MPVYEIWIGRPYFAGRAYMCGTAEGETFKAACMAHFSNKDTTNFDENSLRYYGAKLYPYDPEAWRERLQRMLDAEVEQSRIISVLTVLDYADEIDFLSRDEEILIHYLVQLLDNYDDIIS